jgi:chorismate synthase
VPNEEDTDSDHDTDENDLERSARDTVMEVIESVIAKYSSDEVSNVEVSEEVNSS